MQDMIATLPPHSLDSEEAVLGSILINPESLALLAPDLAPEDFFIVKNRWVYQAILRLYERGDDIDTLTVSEELQSAKQLDDIGGPAFILYLANSTPTHIHANTYSAFVERAGTRRELLAAASVIGKIALNQDSEIEDVLRDAEAALLRVTNKRRASRIEPASKKINAFVERIEALSKEANHMIGIPTGYADLDTKHKGLRRRNVTVIGGRPGMTKTTFAINISRNMLEAGYSVAFFSLEMSEQEIINKFLACEAKLDSDKLQAGLLDVGSKDSSDWSALYEAQEKFNQWRLFTDDKQAVTPNYILQICRVIKAQYGLDVIFVDYLQLMSADGRHDNRTNEIGAVSRALQNISVELDVAVVAIAQLSRAVEQRENKRPVLSDLRDSGAIEQDAAVVWFLYREEYYDAKSPLLNQTEVITAKNRHGERFTGTTSLLADLPRSRYYNLAKPAQIAKAEKLPL